jgi:predicted transcriptional regulator
MLKNIKKNKFFQLWLIIGIIAGFAGVIFFTITYLNENILCDLHCRNRNEVTLVMILLSFFGVFVGSLTYYFISEKYEKRMTRIQGEVEKTLNFLENDEKKIIKTLIDNSGTITQASLVKDTKLTRVRISRSLKVLEQKNLIKKEPSGMTNNIILDSELLKLFNQ